MKKKIILAAVLTVAAAAVVVMPLAASADHDRELTIGVRLDFTSSTEATGTFAVCCAVNDGAAKALITSYRERGSQAKFEATNTFDGKKGSFTILLRGTTGPLGSDRHVADARWHVIAGSGAYEDLEAHGDLTAVTDQTTGALTAIDTGRIER